MTATPHFRDRCRERIPDCDCPDTLFSEIIIAVDRGMEEFAQFVKSCPETGQPWYRIGTAWGTFYVPMSRGRGGKLIPATIYDQDMWRRKRRGMKQMKRIRSSVKYNPERRRA